MNNKFDSSSHREFIISDEFKDISNYLKIFDDNNCTFYYDESNNIRKLWLNKGNFNAPINSDFILGGVMCFGDNCSVSVDVLKKKLHLHNSINEIKFKHISKAKAFMDCINEDKVNYFLKWLYDSDLYIHCSNVNNLYYTIVDIIDSIPGYDDFSFQIKNELYKLARHHYKDFYALLIDCIYPNIASKDISTFCNHIIAYIDNDYKNVLFILKFLDRL